MIPRLGEALLSCLGDLVVQSWKERQIAHAAGMNLLQDTEGHAVHPS